MKRFVWDRSTVVGKLKRILPLVAGGFVGSIALAFVYYMLFSSVFLTDEQKRMKQENEQLRSVLPQVQEKMDLLEDEMQYLDSRDINIYRQIFHADIPSVSMLLEEPLQDNDEVACKTLSSRNELRSKAALSRADSIELSWRKIIDTLCCLKTVPMPVITPVKDLNYSNIGASVGTRMSPFFKIEMSHGGLDMIAPYNTPVYATAAGRVSRVSSSNGGSGKTVEITHPGGYVTRYAHLSEINVPKGRVVKAGTLIGYVGDSGRSFATHLHYEVLKDGQVQDPIHYFFGSVSPDDYLKMQIMSLFSGQSMD